MKKHSTSPFKIIGARQIEGWLDAHPTHLVELVKKAYLVHSVGKTVNPDSYFLRFPDSKNNRIIALPASIEDDEPVAGIKWIASFPENIDRGLDRASALLILNDRQTGYPVACMEGSAISAARTAASAVVGAQQLHSTPGVCRRLGVVGCGLIAHRIVTLLIHSGWKIDSVQLTDLSDERAQLFASKCQKMDLKSQISDLTETLQTSDLVIFATSAVSPQPMDTAWFAHAPTVLHMSLRDLPPAVILISQNVADDVEHCVKAGTSLDLTCQLAGNRDCIAGSIADVINGRIVPDASRPRVFSPFGMGILDLAVARDIEKSLRHDEILTLPDFFPVPYTA